MINHSLSKFTFNKETKTLVTEASDLVNPTNPKLRFMESFELYTGFREVGFTIESPTGRKPRFFLQETMIDKRENEIIGWKFVSLDEPVTAVIYND